MPKTALLRYCLLFNRCEICVIPRVTAEAPGIAHLDHTRINIDAVQIYNPHNPPIVIYIFLFYAHGAI